VCIAVLVGATPAFAQGGPGLAEAATVPYPTAGVPGVPHTASTEAAPSTTLHFYADAYYANGAEVPASLFARQDRRSGVTWLVVGAALIGAGLLIDGDAGTAVSIGGALLGAYGVFLMVRR
jgi:hypothetical protein